MLEYPYVYFESLSIYSFNKKTLVEWGIRSIIHGVVISVMFF